MSPAAHHLLRALYLHALAPSAAKQDAVRAAGAALDTETARALNAPRDAPNEAATLNAAPAEILISAVGDDDARWVWQVWDDVSEISAEGVVPSLADALAQVAGVVGAPRIQPSSGNVFRDLGRPDADAKFDAAKEAAAGWPRHTDALPIAEAVSRKILDRAAFGLCKYGVSLDDAGLDPAARLLHLQEELLDGANYVESFMRAMRETPATAPVEPPHAAVPVLAPLAPEPAEAVLGRAGEALTGSLPVYVLAGTGRHPYGDDAWHMETDGVARLFPNREAAQRWLAAMGRAPA